VGSTKYTVTTKPGALGIEWVVGHKKSVDPDRVAVDITWPPRDFSRWNPLPHVPDIDPMFQQIHISKTLTRSCGRLIINLRRYIRSAVKSSMIRSNSAYVGLILSKHTGSSKIPKYKIFQIP